VPDRAGRWISSLQRIGMHEKLMCACKFHETGENHARELRDASGVLSIAPNAATRLRRTLLSAPIEDQCQGFSNGLKIFTATRMTIPTIIAANHECDSKRVCAIAADVRQRRVGR
jgi:hypothetical protein